MKTNRKSIIWIFSAFLICFSFLAFTNTVQDPWPVPKEFKEKKNPTKASPENMKVAKTLWTKHCKSCHGEKGLGDGKIASRLKTPSGDFSLKSFHAQTDGEMYFKTIKGRGDMPGYEKKLDSEDNWLLVHYMRTMKAGD